jgi:hypothetical protein
MSGEPWAVVAKAPVSGGPLEKEPTIPSDTKSVDQALASSDVVGWLFTPPVKILDNKAI